MTAPLRRHCSYYPGLALVALCFVLAVPAAADTLVLQAQAQGHCQWLGSQPAPSDRDHLSPHVPPVSGQPVEDRLALALRYAGEGQSFEGQNEPDLALDQYLNALDVFRGGAAELQSQPPQPQQVEFLLAYTLVAMDVARLRAQMGQSGRPPYCYDTTHEYGQYWSALQQALGALDAATKRDTALRVGAAASSETWKIFYVRYWYQLMRGDVAGAEWELRQAYQLNPANVDLRNTLAVQQQAQQQQALPAPAPMQPAPTALPPGGQVAAPGATPRGIDWGTVVLAAKGATWILARVVPQKYRHGVAAASSFLNVLLPIVSGK